MFSIGDPKTAIRGIGKKESAVHAKAAAGRAGQACRVGGLGAAAMGLGSVE